MRKDDKNFKTCVVLAFLVVIAFMISVSFKVNSKGKGFKISELDEGVGYQICTSSVQAPFLYEKDGNRGFQVNSETTQEDIDNWIKDHPNTIITKGSVCIGDYLEIRRENG